MRESPASQSAPGCTASDTPCSSSPRSPASDRQVTALLPSPRPVNLALTLRDCHTCPSV